MTSGVPFSSVAEGLPGRALLVLAVDRVLPGVLLTGPVGAGKSTRLTAFSAWLHAHEGGPVRGMPLSVDRDRIIGGVDLERTLAERRKVISRGILDEATGGWVLVDNLHLAEPSNLVLLKQRIDSTGDIRVLAASSAEETPWPHLADVLPMHVGVVGTDDLPDFWARLVSLSEPGSWGSEEASRWSDADGALAATVQRARASLRDVAVSDQTRARLIDSALGLGVTSPRADVYALRVARAHAALCHERAVGDEDVAFAIATVLAPRGVSGPPPSTAPDQASRDAGDREGGRDRAPDQVFDPIPAALPDLQSLIGRARGAVSGRRATRRAMDRGRHLRSRPGRRGRRLAVGETLRRAAVRQASESIHPPISRGKLPGRGDGPVVRVKRADLCFRELRSRAGTLFLVAVDASGSMAWHRMQEAKGLVGALLADAYRRRDALALVTFRGERATCVLGPTSALARARRELEVLPTGGGTPLSSALDKLIELARTERHKRARPVCAIVLTDGRANVPLDPTTSGRAAASLELERIAARYRVHVPMTLVVDTSGLAAGRDDAKRLASMLGASFHRL
ncbi:MAG: VWA domain-containing protein [Planctomycetes bacterium]|nr:VWA domain-containing protein [Planctomycetota bacterium]